jgi:hypothetical protein
MDKYQDHWSIPSRKMNMIRKCMMCKLEDYNVTFALKFSIPHCTVF